MKRRALRIAAVLAVPVALLLLALAVDVVLLQRATERDDVRFQFTSAGSAERWRYDGLLPFSVAARLLAVGDDIGYRRAMAAFGKVQPGKETGFGPDWEALQGEARLELTKQARAQSDPRRRAELLVNLGVIALGLNIYDDVERQSALATAVDSFRSATELDPENDDALVNLELALRDPGAVLLPGNAPTGSQDDGELSGAGSSSGGGY